MQQRIITKLPKAQARRVEIKTFAKVMLEQYRQIDSTRRLIVGGELSNYIHRIAKKQAIGYDKIQEYESTIDVIGRSFDTAGYGAAYLSFYDTLQSTLKRYGRVDLNTVAKEVVLALENNRIKPLTHTHVIVDEFQDSDEQQLRWLVAHISESRYFCVVGDDDQSIYAWRGAKGYQNMVEYQRIFKAKAYMLTNCFRCSPAILGIAQELIEFNESRIPKDMHSKKSEKGKVNLLVTPMGFESRYTKTMSSQTPEESSSLPSFMDGQPIETYRHIVDEIEQARTGLAILCRTNKHLNGLEYCLSERGIATERIGGRSIFDNPHAIGLTHLLIGFVYPERAHHLVEGMSWLGIEETILEHLNHLPRNAEKLNIAAENSSYLVVQQLHQLRQQCLNQKLEPDEMVSQFRAAISTHFKANQDDFHIQRSAILHSLFGILHKTKGAFGDRVNALQSMALSSSSKGKVRDENKVTLCTMTGAKGLEWPRVVVMMLNRQVIPSEVGNDESVAFLEEERRLLYVAMTRAEEYLTLHFNERSPSCFIKELGLI